MMETLLQNPDTRALWSYFLGLSRIPRGSKAEAVAADWVAEQGRALGCQVERDAIGNVLIRKPGTPGRENRAVVALQAHVDMVCEKNEGTAHDFLKDPLQLVLEGDLLRASGTTLGADNGIGVCAGLALLASKDVAHGPIEVLITIDEETGLTGASNLASDWLRAKYLLNLDSEEEGRLTIGCAGGLDTIATRPAVFKAPSAGKQAYRLKVSGLKGGHSGTEIHTGRGNAIRLLAQVLSAMTPRYGMELTSVMGGNKRNAIPREAFAVFCMDPAQESAFKDELGRHEADWRSALGSNEPDLGMSLEKTSAAKVLSPEDAFNLLGLLLGLPHGVEAMSPDIPGLTQTSTNLGVVQTRETSIEVTLLTRSSIDASKYALAERISAICALAGFQSVIDSAYSGWKPDPSSALVKRMGQVHEELFGKPMEVSAIHAGLECGLIGEKYRGMEMVSFGPDMWEVHTPNEHVSVSSVANFWKLLVGVVEAL
jgi:dipeptidase D